MVLCFIFVIIFKSKVKDSQPQFVRIITMLSPTTAFWVLYLFKGDACTIYVVIMTGVFLPFNVITGILDNIAGVEKMLR